MSLKLPTNQPEKPDKVGAILLAVVSPIVTFFFTFVGSSDPEFPEMGLLCAVALIIAMAITMWSTSKTAVILTIILNGGLIYYLLQLAR